MRGSSRVLRLRFCFKVALVDVWLEASGQPNGDGGNKINSGRRVMADGKQTYRGQPEARVTQKLPVFSFQNSS